MQPSRTDDSTYNGPIERLSAFEKALRAYIHSDLKLGGLIRVDSTGKSAPALYDKNGEPIEAAALLEDKQQQLHFGILGRIHDPTLSKYVEDVLDAVKDPATIGTNTFQAIGAFMKRAQPAIVDRVQTKIEKHCKSGIRAPSEAAFDEWKCVLDDLMKFLPKDANPWTDYQYCKMLMSAMPRDQDMQNQMETLRTIFEDEGKLSDRAFVTTKLRAKCTSVGIRAEEAAEMAQHAALVALHDKLMESGADVHQALAAVGQSRGGRQKGFGSSRGSGGGDKSGQPAEKPSPNHFWDAKFKSWKRPCRHCGGAHMDSACDNKPGAEQKQDATKSIAALAVASESIAASAIDAPESIDSMKRLFGGGGELTIHPTAYASVRVPEGAWDPGPECTDEPHAPTPALRAACTSPRHVIAGDDPIHSASRFLPILLSLLVVLAAFAAGALLTPLSTSPTHVAAAAPSDAFSVVRDFPLAPAAMSAADVCMPPPTPAESREQSHPGPMVLNGGGRDAQNSISGFANTPWYTPVVPLIPAARRAGYILSAAVLVIALCAAAFREDWALRTARGANWRWRPVAFWHAPVQRSQANFATFRMLMCMPLFALTAIWSAANAARRCAVAAVVAMGKVFTALAAVAFALTFMFNLAFPTDLGLDNNPGLALVNSDAHGDAFGACACPACRFGFPTPAPPGTRATTPVSLMGRSSLAPMWFGWLPASASHVLESVRFA